MKLSEWLDGKNLFDAMFDNGGTFPFLDTPKDRNAYQTALLMTHGNRTVASSIIPLDLESVASVLVLNMEDKWDNLTQLGGSTRRELTETINKSEERSDERSDVNKVSAFNEENLVDNEGSSSTGTWDSAGNVERKIVDERFDYKLLSYSDRLTIMQTVLSDIQSTLTLSIQE